MKTLKKLLLATGISLALVGCPDPIPPNPIEISKHSYIYDDFSSETLDTEKWEIRKDYEGQPLIADSGLDNINHNFHTAQDSIIGDHRTYLVPKQKFKVGDIFEFDMDFISASGNSISMLLIDKQHRIGLGGSFGGICQPFQTYHIKLEFKESSIKIMHNLWEDEVVINSNPEHEIYIGTVFGHNGTGHIDYDNFNFYGGFNKD